MDFVGVWAVRLARRGWRATVLLALLCGLAAGVAMTATAAGRRSATAFDEFFAFADPPDLVLNICPPEITQRDEVSLQACTTYVPNPERDVIASLPEVEEAVIASFRSVTVAPVGTPDAARSEVAMVTSQPGAPRLDGRQLLVQGRRYAPDAPDEVVVNERLFADLGIELGEAVDLTFWSREEFGQLNANGSFHGETVRASVVGVSRGVSELGDNQTGSAVNELSVLAGPGIARATPETLGYTGLLVEAAGGDSAAADAAISSALPDMLANFGAALEEDEIDPIRDAIRYEAYGVMVFGGLAALAAVVFCGQAIARQTRREWLDLPTLRALGVTGTQARQATLARAAVVAILAILVAAATSVTLSPVGPVGVARDAELDPGVAVDWWVLGAGSLLIAAVVLGSSAVTIRRLGARSEPGPGRARSWAVGWLPPAPSAGLAMSRPARRPDQVTPLGTAVAGAALAVLTIVAALGVRASLDGLRQAPERIGAPWDVSLASADDDPRASEARTALAERSVVTAAADLVGTDADIEGDSVWVHAFVPLDDVAVLPPPILSGRAPTADNEIALGAVTARDLGLVLGDVVMVRSTTSADQEHELEIVGTAIVNDTYETCGGCGGIVTPEFIASFAPEAAPDPTVYRVAPGTDVDALISELEQIFPGGALGPVAQQAVRNVERIRFLPVLLAALASVLALASMGHALVLNLRRHRGELAVLRSIGFTRAQIRWVVVTHAASLGALAIVVGVPLGLILARQGWRMLVDRIGVAFVPEIPAGSLAVAVVVVVATIVAMALVLARSVVRARPATALRVE